MPVASLHNTAAPTSPAGLASDIPSVEPHSGTPQQPLDLASAGVVPVQEARPVERGSRRLELSVPGGNPNSMPGREW